MGAVAPAAPTSTMQLLDKRPKLISIRNVFEADLGRIVSRWVFLLELDISGVTTFSSLAIVLKLTMNLAIDLSNHAF